MRNPIEKPFWRSFITAAAAAVVGNSAIYIAAGSAGVGFGVTSAGTSTTIPYAQVACMSVVSVVAGAAVLRLATRRASLVEVAAVFFTLVSLGAPLTMGSNAAADAVLAAMHVFTGAVFILAAEATRGQTFVVARHRERASSTARPAPSI